MLQHSRIMARDIGAARRFYSAMARPLGLAVVETQEDGFALGRLSDAGNPVLRVKAAGSALTDDAAPETQLAHVALEAPDDFTVRAFYRAALEAGGRQLGYPGPQPVSGYSYYSAKVTDPDGNCIECGWRH